MKPLICMKKFDIHKICMKMQKINLKMYKIEFNAISKLGVKRKYCCGGALLK